MMDGKRADDMGLELESLPEVLRETATYLGVADTGETAERAKHLMQLAADRLENYEATDRERLEHEAVAPGDFGLALELAGLPPIPMRESYSTGDLGLLAYTVDMVAWVRAVTEREAK